MCEVTVINKEQHSLYINEIERLKKLLRDREEDCRQYRSALEDIIQLDEYGLPMKRGYILRIARKVLGKDD